MNQRKQSRIGRFRLLARIGEGGFGRVFRALDPILDRQVAVKIPVPGRLPLSESRRQFKREARAASSIQHPGVVTIYECGDDTGLPFIVSELVDGRSLSQCLAQNSISLDESVKIVIQAADVLEAIHRQGFVHRDVKPGNLLISTTGRVQLTDFGLAIDRRNIEGELDDLIFGTPAFMAPEKLADRAVFIDGRADVFGLGVVLYRLLTGVFPFRGTGSFAMHQIIEYQPPFPCDLNAEVPELLGGICQKAIEKNRRHRYQSAKDFANALRAWLLATTGSDSAELVDYSSMALQGSHLEY